MTIPVVLCGRLEKVGSIVISELEPDYEGKKSFTPLHGFSRISQGNQSHISS
jgi:hypothetical protein